MGVAVGVLTVELRIPQSRSLKKKRMIIRSLKDRLSNKFNVSIAEVDNLDKWSSAVLAIAHVSNSRPFTDSTLSKILNFIDDFREAELADHQIDLL